MPLAFRVALAIALLGCVWNIVAGILNWLFGVHLPVVDPGTY